MTRNIPVKIYHWLLVCFFLLAFFAPAVRMFTTKTENYSVTEKRLLADFPPKPASVARLQSFFSEIDTFLDDHFGFREFFIYRYQREVRKRFGITGKQANVHQGTDHWLFLEVPGMMLDYAGKKRITEEALENWLDNYASKRKWLKEQGIDYLLVVAPDKKSVYPEFVMEQWKDVHAPGAMRRFAEQYPEIAARELLNLYETLQKHKHEDLLYYKSGTHWTDYGAYIAYLSIAEKIETLLPPRKFRKDFSFSTRRKRLCTGRQAECGDLVGMLMDYEPFQESFRRYQPYKSRIKRLPMTYPLSNLPKDNRQSVITVCPKKKLTAVVFRDSFFNALWPYFSENFRQVVYLWKPYDQKNMEEIMQIFKPDIVVEEVVERNLFSQ